MTFRTTVERVGKRVALQIPDHVAKELGLRPGQWVTADLRTDHAPPPKRKKAKARTLRRRRVACAT